MALNSPSSDWVADQLSKESEDLSIKVSSVESMDLKPGKPKQALINQPPKKP
jgi:hypothetical protein